MKRMLYIYLAAAGLSSCVPSLTKEEYQVWLNEHKETLTARATCGTTSFTLEYIPAALIAARSGNFETEDYKEQFVFLAEQQANTSDFIESFQSYADLYIDKDFVLVQGQDSLSCIATHTVNSSLSAVSRQMILLFDGRLIRNGRAVKVLYKDQIFGCKTPILFEFKNLDVRKLPNLKNTDL